MNVDSSMHKVVVIHALRPTSRQTTIDHLLSFREHLPQADVQYLHFQQPLSDLVRSVEPDLLVFNYDFLNYRFSPLWPFISQRFKKLADQSAKVIAITQDEFWGYRLLDNFCSSLKVDRVLTGIDRDRHVLFPKSIRKSEFVFALTGYASSHPEPFRADLATRPIDLGQRVRRMPAHLGSYAQTKSQQAIHFAEIAESDGFVVDVSTDPNDGFVGRGWKEFLQSCKFTLGMKGGASLIDPWGLLYTKVQAHERLHPEMTFDQMRRSRFMQSDGRHVFTGVSPRLFESAELGTCQILQEDFYLDGMEPWQHFIPLRSDFSNAEVVVGAMRDLDKAQQIAANARELLIDAGKFGYDKFVEHATDGLLGETTTEANGWSKFVGYLREMNRCFAVDHLLHDAAQHLALSMAFGDEEELTNRASSRRILQCLRDNGLGEWFEQLVHLTRDDRATMRSVWPWRPL